MQSLSLLPVLEGIPLNREHKKYTYADVAQMSKSMKGDFFAIEVAIGVETACLGIFDARHVPDDLREAFQKSFSNIAEHQSLYEHYLQMTHDGPESVVGFISSLKGKLAELRYTDLLSKEFPEVHWDLASNPIQPDWDIMGHIPGGSDLPIQVKMGGAAYAGEVTQRMHDTPHTVFAVSKEIHDRIVSDHPELAHQVGSLGVSNLDFHHDLEGNLNLLAHNHGVDVPDGVGDILPYIKEIILGIRLICDIVAVERDFKAVHIKDRGRIHALKAIVLMSRFGISTICTLTGAATGTATIPIPGWGSAIGAVGGAGLSMYLNGKFKPHIMEIAMGLFELSEDDMFYLRNKLAIDRIGYSLRETSKKIV